MRFRVSLVSVLLCLPAALANPRTAWAQSGSLQLPSHPNRDEPAKPPVAAPRQPVRQTGTAAGPVGQAPPVVSPHGAVHPRKPPSKAAGAARLPDKVETPAAKTASGPATGAAVAVDPAIPDAKAGPADKLVDPEKPEGPAAKLPRFASLRSDDVNMRLGPGTRYRIDWVYKRRDLPVEIEREFDVWRWVRDPEGIHGWVHQATLMGRRSFIVQGSDATLRSEASDTAASVAVLKIGVIGRIRSCEAASDWCNVQTGSYRGYVRRQQVWGLLPGEAIAP